MCLLKWIWFTYVYKIPADYSPNTPVHFNSSTGTSDMRFKDLFGLGCLYSSMSVINYLISTSIFRPVTIAGRGTCTSTLLVVMPRHYKF